MGSMMPLRLELLLAGHSVRAIPGMGVFGPGNVPSPARMAGPYVPLCLLKKCLWVSGVPTYKSCTCASTLFK